jgi:hypothetical protein
MNDNPNDVSGTRGPVIRTLQGLCSKYGCSSRLEASGHSSLPAELSKLNAIA